MEGKGQRFSALGRLPQTAEPRTLEEIQRRTPRVAGTVELHNLPASTTLTPLAPLPPPEYTLPFHPLGFSQAASGGNNINVVLQPALVKVRHVEQMLTNGGGITFEEPLINNTSMWTVPLPELTLADRKSYNYLVYNTNELGFPTTTFNIESDTNTRNCVYHLPPDGDGTGGRTGEYHVELFRTDLDSNVYQNRVVHKWGGILPWYSDLWHGSHPQSNGAQPYIRFDEFGDEYHFRTHVEGHGHNITQDPSSNSNAILHEFCGRNIGTGSSNYANVYTGNTETNCAEFNIIKERDTGSQVKVIQGTNESPILIRGNYKDLTLNFKDCAGNVVASVDFLDGLVINEGVINVTLGNC